MSERLQQEVGKEMSKITTLECPSYRVARQIAKSDFKPGYLILKVYIDNPRTKRMNKVWLIEGEEKK